MEVSSDSEKEVIGLRKKLREVEMERDILKKAALIFGKSGDRVKSCGNRFSASLPLASFYLTRSALFDCLAS